MQGYAFTAIRRTSLGRAFRKGERDTWVRDAGREPGGADDHGFAAFADKPVRCTGSVQDELAAIARAVERFRR